VVSGRTLAPGMHPYPLRKPPETAPHNHLYRNNRDGTFTDVTVSAGLATDLYSMAGGGRRLRQRRQTRICW